MLTAHTLHVLGIGKLHRGVILSALVAQITAGRLLGCLCWCSGDALVDLCRIGHSVQSVAVGRDSCHVLE